MSTQLRTWFLISMAMLLLVACTRTVAIKDILDQPREYADKKIAVEGEVSGAFSLIFIKYFMVKDGTGEIGVVSEKPLPKIGQKIRITGTVKEAFSLGDQRMTILIEDAPEKTH